MVLRVSSRVAPVPSIGVDISAGQRRDSRQMLQRVERRAFGGEHRPRIAFEAHQRHCPLRRGRRRCTELSIRRRGSSARKKAAATSSPATTIGSRQFISAVKRASAAIVAAEVTSPPEPRSSASTRRTKSIEVEVADRRRPCRACKRPAARPASAAGSSSVCRRRRCASGRPRSSNLCAALDCEFVARPALQGQGDSCSPSMSMRLKLCSSSRSRVEVAVPAWTTSAGPRG